MTMSVRAAADEHDEFYSTYTSKVPDGPILETLERQIGETLALLAGVDEAQADFRYAPGKWSVKEVVGHVSDVERVFCYRALSFARRDPAPLPGIEQDDFLRHAGFARRTLPDLAAELAAVRQATLAFFRSVDDETALARGTASGCEFTVRALAWIIAGHELHHRLVLEERYLR